MRYIKPSDETDIRSGNYNIVGTTAILINDAGRVLLLLRDDIPTIRYPGHWSTLGGAIEPGETAEQAIRRELQEEIGYAVSAVDHYGQILDDYHNLIHVFVARIDKPIEDLVLNEGQEIKFFDTDDLPVTISPHSKDVIDHYIRSRGGGSCFTEYSRDV